MSRTLPFRPTLIALAVAGVSLAPSAIANQLLALDEIIITGTTSAKTKLETSVSVSTVDASEIGQYAPRSTAEILRNIPGIRSESSGGEGNANIAVRGLPVAAGGAKFLQLHEDGLPVMQFGDIAFGNADIFLRADATIARIEAIRGGSASTLASNSPGGIINFISKTGEEAGGSLSMVLGLDYDNQRTEFEYGSPFGQDWSFHIGGYVREGTGPRDPGYTATSGGQIKANLTRNFDNGYVRLYAKHLDDKSIGYLPMPMTATGGSLPGFDSLHDTPHSAYLLSNLTVDGDGNRRRSSVADGMNPVSSSFGAEFSFDLTDDLTLTNRFRRTSARGRFVSPFPAQVDDAQLIADDIGGAGSSLSYANGSRVGESIANPSSLNGNGLAMRVHLFDVELHDLGSYSNDTKLTQTIGLVDVTLGYYRGSQNIEQSWLWNSYLMEVKGNNAALLNVTNSAGDLVTDNGLIAYGVPFWGNCCTRNYDARYDIQAPYLALEFLLGPVTLDMGVRYDRGQARGTYAGTVQRENVDMNNDGVISVPEQSVSFIDTANPSPINYDWDYVSYSLGANYLVNNDLAVFGRISHGGRANADRLLFGPNVLPSGRLLDDDAAVDHVDQIELGVKYQLNNLNLFITAFHAETEEQNYEATTQTFFDRKYEAMGLEFEAAYQWGNFVLNGGVTYTDAEIVRDPLNPDVVGNTPRRQPDFIYSMTPAYETDRFKVGANIIGVTDSYAQDNNDLKLRSYNQVNAFVDYYLTDSLSLSLNVNNLFDEVGLTEAEQGSVPDNGIITARSINGRSSTLSLRYTF